MFYYKKEKGEKHPHFTSARSDIDRMGKVKGKDSKKLVAPKLVKSEDTMKNKGLIENLGPQNSKLVQELAASASRDKKDYSSPQSPTRPNVSDEGKKAPTLEEYFGVQGNKLNDEQRKVINPDKVDYKDNDWLNG